MASVGTGYDLSATTFSPDGRVFQVEYAAKAVETCGTVLGVVCKDGVVIACEKLVQSKLYAKGSNRRVLAVDRGLGAGFAGVYPDAKLIAARARNESSEYKDSYGSAIPTEVLAERMGLFVQAYTLYGHLRPFGVSSVFGGYDENGPALFMIDPSGLTLGYYGVALGKGQLPAKTELERLKLPSITCREVLAHLARIIHSVHDDVKDKPFELEMGWVCDESNRKFVRVPDDLVAKAEEEAKKALEEQDAMED